MITYKFAGLTAIDAPTQYHYGSLPAKPALGHILFYEETGNRYAVIQVEGEGLVGDGGYADQKYWHGPRLVRAKQSPRCGC
jgi:hypothetical protein